MPNSTKQKNSTHLIPTDLPKDVNFRRAVRFAQFCSYADRLKHNSENTIEALDKENARIDEIAKDMGLDGATVIRTEDVQVVVFYNHAYEDHPAEISVAFSGSNQDRKHFFRNIDYLKMVPSGFGENINVHKGFNSSLEKPSTRNPDLTLWDEVQSTVAQLNRNIPEALVNFTGHSAGGAIGMIAASRWMGAHQRNHVDQIITFAQPRVGGTAFRDAIESKVGKNNILRFELDGDPVPALPPFNRRNYRHCGKWIPFLPDGTALERENSDYQPTEDTSAYRKDVTAPTWQEVEQNPDAKRPFTDLRSTTRRWYQFMLGGFDKRHMIPVYYKSLNRMAREQEKEHEAETKSFAPIFSRDFVGRDFSDDLMWHAISLEEALSSAPLYNATDDEKAAFKAAAQDITDKVINWPRHLKKHHIGFLKESLTALLDAMPASEISEPFSEARQMAQNALALAEEKFPSKDKQAQRA